MEDPYFLEKTGAGWGEKWEKWLLDRRSGVLLRFYDKSVTKSDIIVKRRKSELNLAIQVENIV